MARKDDPSVWKQKYFDCLEIQEKQEARLADLDALLRTGIARLTLAAEGQDPALDRELGVLRKLTRGKQALDEFRLPLDRLSDTLRDLEKKRLRKPAASSATSADARELMETILQKLRVAPTWEPGLAKLRERLADLNDYKVLDDVPAFLAKVSRQSWAPPPESTAPGKPAVTTFPALQALDVLIDQLHLPVADKSALTRLRAVLAAGRAEQEWQALVRELVDLLNRRLDGAASVARIDTPTPATNAVLLELLHHIPLPGALAGQLESIRERLAQEIPAAEWPQVLNAIADLIADMRKRIEAEKSDLENFLLQITGRLKELDATLQGADRQRRSAYEDGLDLDRTVQEQVSGIATSMQQSTTLDQLKQAVQGRIDIVRQRMDDYRHKEEQRNSEMEQRLQAMQSRLQDVERESVDLRTTLRQRREQALQDALTGVANRLAWEERLAQEYTRWQRYQTPLALLVMDVDHFKQINDRYGHKAGDKALQLIARVLRRNLRDADFLARYGGEEFVALISEDSVTHIPDVAEKLRRAVEQAGFNYRGESVPITLSCGYASFHNPDTTETVFQRADAALYHAKADGRNRCLNGDGLPSNP